MGCYAGLPGTDLEEEQEPCTTATGVSSLPTSSQARLTKTTTACGWHLKAAHYPAGMER